MPTYSHEPTLLVVLTIFTNEALVSREYAKSARVPRVPHSKSYVPRSVCVYVTYIQLVCSHAWMDERCNVCAAFVNHKQGTFVYLFMIIMHACHVMFAQLYVGSKSTQHSNCRCFVRL